MQLEGFISNERLTIGDLSINNQDFVEVTQQAGLAFAFGKSVGDYQLSADTVLSE